VSLPPDSVVWDTSRSPDPLQTPLFTQSQSNLRILKPPHKSSLYVDKTKREAPHECVGLAPVYKVCPRLGFGDAG